MEKSRLPKQALQCNSKVATTCTEDGHRLPKKKHYNINQKWLHHVQRMDTNTLPNKQYNINQKWLQLVQRMDTNRLPKQALKFKPKLATTCTEDGYKQTTKTNTTI